MGSGRTGLRARRVTPPAPTADETTEAASGWAWRWISWASWPVTPVILAVAVTAVVLDVVTAWWGHPRWTVGGLVMSPALPLGVVLAALVGPARVGLCRRSLQAWGEFVIVVGGMVAIASLAYERLLYVPFGLSGLVLGVVGEELVFRLAAIIVFGSLFARLSGHDWHDTSRWGVGPGVGALVAAGVVFSFLPGHVAQMGDVTTVAPFLSLGVVLGYVALRTGSLVPGVLVHLLANLTALLYLQGRLGADARFVVVTGAMVAMVAAAAVAGRRLGLLRRMPAVIDLRTDVSNPAAGELDWRLAPVARHGDAAARV